MRNYLRLLQRRKTNLLNLLENSCVDRECEESHKLTGAIEELDFFMNIVEAMSELEMNNSAKEINEIINKN